MISERSQLSSQNFGQRVVTLRQNGWWVEWQEIRWRDPDTNRGTWDGGYHYYIATCTGVANTGK